MMDDITFLSAMRERFRGFLPVIVDIESAGFEASTDALLEVAAVLVAMDERGHLYPTKTIHHHVQPFPGAHLEQRALEFTGIIPDHPFRYAVSEHQALQDLYQHIRKALKQQQCQRAVLVGHNAWFDLSFIKAANERAQLKNMPFHHFTSFDTATLSGLILGQTVLAKALEAAGIAFDPKLAHSAIYDAEKTAELFCYLVNSWLELTARQQDLGIRR
jgi:ribonuclease T